MASHWMKYIIIQLMKQLFYTNAVNLSEVTLRSNNSEIVQWPVLSCLFQAHWCKPPFSFSTLAFTGSERRSDGTELGKITVNHSHKPLRIHSCSNSHAVDPIQELFFFFFLFFFLFLMNEPKKLHHEVTFFPTPHCIKPFSPPLITHSCKESSYWKLHTECKKRGCQDKNLYWKRFAVGVFQWWGQGDPQNKRSPPWRHRSTGEWNQICCLWSIFTLTV